MEMTTRISADSREIAQAFGARHHNILKAIDLVLRQCPDAYPHFRFEQHPVPAGLGGTRYVRHVMIDRIGFMLIAMAFPSTQRDLARRWLLTFSDLTAVR